MTYTKPVCKGCYALGTACGRCERCIEERQKMTTLDQLKADHEALGRRIAELDAKQDQCADRLFVPERGSLKADWLYTQDSDEFAEAIEVMMLCRLHGGDEVASDNREQWIIEVRPDFGITPKYSTGRAYKINLSMFGIFASREACQHAIDTIGAERITKAAKILARAP